VVFDVKTQSHESHVLSRNILSKTLYFQGFFIMSFFKDVIIIANVAINGSNITESTKPGHVTYSIENYEFLYYTGGGTDSNGDPIPYVSHYGWVDGGSGSTGAKITGTVICSNSMKVNGTSVAKVGDSTTESWIADPPIPTSTDTTRYTATSPISGCGQGSITGGNSKNAKLNGQLIAVVGSEVTTCLGNSTTIADGSSLINL
jgi:hypothetical protein